MILLKILQSEIPLYPFLRTISFTEIETNYSLLFTVVVSSQSSINTSFSLFSSASVLFCLFSYDDWNKPKALKSDSDSWHEFPLKLYHNLHIYLAFSVLKWLFEIISLDKKAQHMCSLCCALPSFRVTFRLLEEVAWF